LKECGNNEFLVKKYLTALQKLCPAWFRIVGNDIIFMLKATLLDMRPLIIEHVAVIYAERAEKEADSK